MIVHKFGGTSLGNAERITHVAEIIHSCRTEAPTVVVSAFRGITDRLIAGARAAALGDIATCREAQGCIAHTHHTIVDQLLPTGSECQDLHFLIDSKLMQLERLFDSLAILRELTARGQDAVACLGEQLSSAIVAAVLRSRGLLAQSIDATEILVTDDRFGSASPQMQATEVRIQSQVAPLVKDGIIPVIAGYIGATRDGVPTTLGRSGSDFSAAIIAACLDAVELCIWTDVNGILTADPHVVPGAHVLRELSYTEATRLARFGAEVLHPRTIGPVIDHGIPLSILNSLNPSDAGTRILRTPSSSRRLWPSIVSATGLQLLRLRSTDSSWELRRAVQALALLDGATIDVRMFSQSFSEQGINLVVSNQDSALSMRLLLQGTAEEGPRSSHGQSLDTLEEVATVSVIGWSVDKRGISSRAFAALGKHGVRVVAVAQEATEDSVTFCIPGADVGDTVRFLHQELGLEDG